MRRFIFISVSMMIFLIGVWLVFGQTQTQEEKPWDWDLNKVRTMVEQVRAGKDLTPQSWPGGAKVAVALSFDFDSETNALRDMNISPQSPSLSRAPGLAVPAFSTANRLFFFITSSSWSSIMCRGTRRTSQALSGIRPLPVWKAGPGSRCDEETGRTVR